MAGDDPHVQMPACVRWHFFKGYRWWCPKCNAELRRQFTNAILDLDILRDELEAERRGDSGQ